jgi:hypothetical protein
MKYIIVKFYTLLKIFFSAETTYEEELLVVEWVMCSVVRAVGE